MIGEVNKLHSSPGPAASCLQTLQWLWLAVGRQRHASAADYLLWQGSGAPCSSSLNQPLLVACAWLDAQQAQRSGLPPSCSKNSVGTGRATAIVADLRALQSVALGAVGEIILFETQAVFANKQSQASPLFS